MSRDFQNHGLTPDQYPAIFTFSLCWYFLFAKVSLLNLTLQSECLAPHITVASLPRPTASSNHRSFISSFAFVQHFVIATRKVMNTQTDRRASQGTTLGRDKLSPCVMPSAPYARHCIDSRVLTHLGPEYKDRCYASSQ